MPEEFDPYHRWLSISPKDQPPDYYRLLGVDRFEDDPEVIRDAAERQISHVRRYQLGPQSDLSQRILNELGAAKGCLQNAAKKAAYDCQLRLRTAASSPTQDSTTALTNEAAAGTAEERPRPPPHQPSPGGRGTAWLEHFGQTTDQIPPRDVKGPDEAREGSPSPLLPQGVTSSRAARRRAQPSAQTSRHATISFSRKTLLMIGGAALGGGLLLTILIVVVWLLFGGHKREMAQADQSGTDETVTAVAEESPPDADNTEPNTPAGDADTSSEKDATGDSQTTAMDKPDKPDKSPLGKPADASPRKPAKTDDEPAAPATKEPPTREEPAAPAMEMTESKPAPAEKPQPPEEPKPKAPEEPKPTPPAEPPPAPPAKKPFEEFSAVVALPPLDSTDPKDLGTVNTTDDKPCSLSLLGGAGVLKGHVFELQPTAAKRWDVTLRKGEEGAETKIASLGLTGTSRLAFRWQPDAKSTAGANQLQNCALSLQVPDAEPKTVALREPLMEAALSLDPDKPLDKRPEWKLEALPDPSLIKIEISAPQSVKYVIEPAGPISADTKGSITVSLEEAGDLFGFKVDIRVTRRAAPQSSGLQVTAVPFFKFQPEGKPESLPKRMKFSQLSEYWMKSEKLLDLQVTTFKDRAKPAPAEQKKILEDQAKGVEQQQGWYKGSLEKLQKAQLSLGAMGGKTQVNLRVYVQADTSEVEILKAGGR